MSNHSTTTSPMPELLVDRQVQGGCGSIITISLNRPEALNSLTATLIRDLCAQFKTLAADTTLAKKGCVVILTGSGRAFSAGVDLSVAAESLFSPASGSPVVSKGFDPENDLVALCRALPIPIIAAINGACYTGGLELALACDVLIAADDAQFCDTHAKFGIAPSWGMSQRLPRLIGTHRALEMSFSALPIGAQQAALWGLVNRVVPAHSLLAECAALARHMLANQPRLITLYKQLVHEGSLMPLGAAASMERDRAAAYYSTMTPQQFAAMKAFVSRGRGEGKASPPPVRPAKAKL